MVPRLIDHRGKMHRFNIPPQKAFSSTPLQVKYRTSLTIATTDFGVVAINPWAAAFSDGLAFPLGDVAGITATPARIGTGGVGNAGHGVLLYSGADATPGATGTSYFSSVAGSGALTSVGGAGGNMGTGHLRFIGADITFTNTSPELEQGGSLYAMLPGHRKDYFSYFNGVMNGLSNSTLGDASHSNRLPLRRSQTIAIIPTAEQVDYKTFNTHVGTLDQESALDYKWRDGPEEFFGSGFGEKPYCYNTAFLIQPSSSSSALITIDVSFHYEAYHIVAGQPTPMTMGRQVDSPNAALRDAMMAVNASVNNAISRGATPTPRTWASMQQASQNPSVTGVTHVSEPSFMHRLGDGVLNAAGRVGNTALRIAESAFTMPRYGSQSMRIGSSRNSGLLTNGNAGPIIEEV